MRKRHGWVLLDVLMGMIIVALLAAILGAAAAMNQRSLQHLADSRAATLEAESALLSLQSHQKPTLGNGGQSSCKKLSDFPKTPNMTWIEVRATVNARTATIIGLVPQNALGEK
jgi:type II secretory pathway pseudopilin PulG